MLNRQHTHWQTLLHVAAEQVSKTAATTQVHATTTAALQLPAALLACYSK
jgi:hypothetical protein